MIRRSLLVFPALLFTLSCGDDNNPTGVRAPGGPSQVISDGTRVGGNKDFFFLPPMVPPPYQNPDFEKGKFNPRLQGSLKIEICQLDPNGLGTDGKPLQSTPCLGAPVKTFEPGTIRLVGMPSQQTGWWTNYSLPADGFYQTLWDTREHTLIATSYYRIKVLVIGSPDPLGVADLDPVANMKEWRNASTGDVVPMIDGAKLPIAFRVERNAFCQSGSECGSATLTNDNPNGDSQVLQVLSAEGLPVAGVLVPDGWLPPGGPQSVVFNIERVNTGTSNVAAGTQQVPCHANVQLQQFDACFHFSTIPELPILDPETGRQFAKPIVGAVCFVLADSDDPRVPWVQLWSSEPEDEDDQPVPLKSADASGILTDHDGHNCRSDETIVTDSRSNVLTRFASIGWQKFTRGVGRVFGVKTAYAVDLGLGGILDGLSNIGPALTAEIRTESPTSQTVVPGTTVTSTVRVVGTRVHNGQPLGDVTTEGHTQGIPGIPVTFSLRNGNGTDLPVTGGNGATAVTVTSSGGGLASVTWTVPASRDNYTLTATGQAKGGPLTFAGATPPDPELTFTATDLILQNGVSLVEYKFAVTNHQAFPAAMFVSAPELEPCNGNANASRTRVDIYNADTDALVETFCAISNASSLQTFSVVRARSAAPLPDVYLKLVDRKSGVTYSSPRVTPVPPPPLLGDLIVSSGPILTPSQITAGVASIITINWGYTNLNATSAFNGVSQNRTYLSTDPVITSSDLLLDSFSTSAGAPGLPAGYSFNVPARTIGIPAREPGVYYIGVVLDENNVVAESNENNNYVTATLTVVAPAAPDLVISSGPPTFTPGTLVSGGSINVSPSFLKNEGGAVSPGDTWVGVGLFLSTDPIITMFDSRFSANAVPRSSLGAGAEVGFGWPTLTVPKVPAGSYYLGVLADLENSVAESNEGNNYVVSGPYTVSWPDLSVINGDWRDEATGSTARLVIGVDGNAASVQAWGDCSPTGCPWGTAVAETSRWATEQTIVAVFETDIATRTVTITRFSPTRIATSMHFNYHDSTPDQTISRLFQLTP